MNYLEYILLGVVQGLTEFFPISSSGHLLLLRKLFGIDEGGLLIEVALHLGTLLSILFFWKKFIYRKIKETLKGDFDYLSTIIIGSIPAGFIGFLFEEKIKDYFFDISSMNYLIVCYIVLAIIIFSTKYFINNKNSIITYPYAFLIGIAQAIAIIPGLSRSGLTIFMALLLGLSFKKSMQFSFMLAVPILIFSSIYLIFNNIELLLLDMNFLMELLVGILSSFLIGYGILFMLEKIINKGIFWYFSFYCLFISLVLFYAS
jgi:undecaprenyl-diphosphatase